MLNNLDHLTELTFQKVEDLSKKNKGSSEYHYQLGKLHAYEEIGDEIISDNTSVFIRICNDDSKHHIFCKDKIKAITVDCKNLTIDVSLDSGEPYEISFTDDERFEQQVDYLYKQLSII